MLPLKSLTVIVSFGCPARMHTPIQFPKVLFPGKARDAVEVVPASTLVCCTSLIPPPPLGLTVKFTPLLATPPTVTITFPVVAPDGTEVTIVVEFQLLVVAVVPLNVTVPEDPKLFPVIVTCAPTVPEVGLKLVMEGPEDDPTVKLTPLLRGPDPTSTTTFPVVAPVGTVADYARRTPTRHCACRPVEHNIATSRLWQTEACSSDRNRRPHGARRRRQTCYGRQHFKVRTITRRPTYRYHHIPDSTHRSVPAPLCWSTSNWWASPAHR